jgi:hypothetical protein
MAKRKRQQPETHPEELVGDGSESREKRRFRLSNWSGNRTTPVDQLPPEDAADVAVVTDEQEAVESGEADPEGAASRSEREADTGSGSASEDDAAPAAGSATDEDSASAAEAPGARAARRSGNPAKSGRFQPAEDSEEDAASRIAVEDEIHEERLRRVAEEMTAGLGNRSVTPTWYKALMLGLMIVGLLWIIVWYITQSALPIPQIGYGNIGIGIGLMMVGLIMTTRWK